MRSDPEDFNDELENMTEEHFEKFLAHAVEGFADIGDAPDRSVSTFEEAGVLSKNKGLVVRIGLAEFQITIVKSQ